MIIRLIKLRDTIITHAMACENKRHDWEVL